MTATAVIGIPGAAGADTTWSVPGDFATIQEAIAAASNGDTIEVGAGVYQGTLDFARKDITIISTDGPEATTLNGANGTGALIGPGGRLEGFTVEPGPDSGRASITTIGFGSEIHGNVIQGNEGRHGTAIGGNISSPIISGNVFRNNSCDDQFLSGVVTYLNRSSPLIINNVFEDNGCRGVNLTLPDDTSPRVVNNTFVGNRVAIRVDRRVDSVGYIIRNNILVGNHIGLEVDFGTEADNPTWENNLVFGNLTDYEIISDQTGLNGNLSVDPSFSGDNDYHLQSDSPAIDAGTSQTAPDDDFDNQIRPTDGDGDGVAEIDIGAFEAAPGDQVLPTVTAALQPIHVGNKRGRFVVDYSCTDNLDPEPVIQATLNGISVTLGQEVVLRVADNLRITTKNGLRIWAPSFALVVTCEDVSGNVATVTATAFGDPPHLTPGAAAITEGTGATKTVNVPVTLSAPSNETITVAWETIDIAAHPSVAHPGTDFIAASGVLTIPPGETNASVAIEVIGDNEPEPPLLFGEWGLVRFSNAENATLNNSFFGLGIFVIVDDD